MVFQHFRLIKELSGAGNTGVSRPQVVAGKAAKFSIVYQQTVFFPFYTNLYQQQFTRNGIAIWNKPTQLSTLLTASYRYYDVIAEADTTYIGYFGNPSGQSRFIAYVQKVSSDGSLAWGDRGSVFSADTINGDPYQFEIYINKQKRASNVWAVCLVKNVYQTSSGVHVQKFNSSTGESLLNRKEQVVLPISPTQSSLAYSHLALCGNKPLFLVTDNTTKIGAVKLNEDGSFNFSSKIQPIATSSNNKFRFGFSDVVNGQAVAVWQEDKGGGDMPFAQNVLCADEAATALIKQPVLNSISIAGLRPNPVTDKMIVSIQSLTAATVQLCVTDISGNIKQRTEQNLVKGSNAVSVTVSTLVRGSYFIKVISAETSGGLLFRKN